MLRRVVIDQVLTVDAVGIPSNDLLGQEPLLVMIFLIGPRLATLVLASDPLCSFFFSFMYRGEEEECLIMTGHSYSRFVSTAN